MTIRYIAVHGNQPVQIPLDEALEICSPTGFTKPVTFSRYVFESGTARLATQEELDRLPREGEGVRHLRPITDTGEVLYRYDTSKISYGLDKLGWPNAWYGEKIAHGYPLYIPEEELFKLPKGTT
jgi:hypothetical protein